MLEPIQPIQPIQPMEGTPNARSGGHSRERQPSDIPADPLQRALGETAAAAARWCSLLSDREQRHLATIPDIGPACEVLLADRLLNDLSPSEREGLRNWVRAEQGANGAWSRADGHPDLSLTAMGWWARLEAGDDPASESMVAALRHVHELGGAQRASFIVRLWLAMAGHAPWSWLPAVPNELWLLPRTMPLSTSRISPWARGIITAYHLLAQTPARLHMCDASPLLLRDERDLPIPPRLTRAGLAGDLLQAFDRSIKLARKLPRGTLERRARRVAMARLEESRLDGAGWLSTRPTLYALLALRAQGAQSTDPRIREGLDALRAARGVVELGGELHLAQGLTQEPLALAVPLRRSAGTLRLEDVLALELREVDDDKHAGGWSLDGGRRGQFDLIATCVCVETLRAIDSSKASRRCEASLRRAATRIASCQDADGGFSRFEAGESRVPLAQLPWRDADLLAVGAADDEARVRWSARALRCLELAEPPAARSAVERGLDWLEERFVRDGRHWSVETLAEVARCTAVFCSPHQALRRNTEASLRRRQREDGSFGSAENTAHALTALVELDGACVQSRRAALCVIAAITRRPTTLNEPAHLCGFGLSPDLRDPSAAVRLSHLALMSYAAAGGTA
jgi:squalene-hopene/tetraprenyl-beta-curcumene cyclase